MRRTYKQFINVKTLLILFFCLFIFGCEGLTFKEDSQSLINEQTYQNSKNEFDKFASEEIVNSKKKATGTSSDFDDIVLGVLFDDIVLGVLTVLLVLGFPIWILYVIDRDGLTFLGIPMDKTAREKQYREDMEMQEKYRKATEYRRKFGP
jgi:hypothetical protein